MSKFGYGIPDNLIMGINSRWIPIGNVKFATTKRKYRRRHNQTCPECGEKKKNIRLHYKKYHPIFWQKFFVKPFYSAQVGQLYGVRFMTTKRKKHLTTNNK